MPASRPSEPSPEWLPSGFPPRSFPPGGGLPPPKGPPPVRSGGGGRGRWLAAAAAFVALLLLAGGLILASRDDGGGSDLAAGTTASTTTSAGAGDTSAPTFDSSTSTTFTATTPAIEPVSTTVAQGTTTVATAAPGGGVLEPSLNLLALPKADATAGAARGTLSLRNSGNAGVTYATTSSSPGLTAAPARGTLAPGVSTTITVTLDAVRIEAEGPFSGSLTFTGAPAAKTVQVQSVVGRPPGVATDVGESCPAPSTICSRQIKLAPTSAADASPCNTPWLYSVQITDQSRIQTSRAIARRGAANADAQLRRGGSSTIFQSDAFAALPAGTVLRFAIEAVDEHGFGRRLAEETIACP